MSQHRFVEAFQLNEIKTLLFVPVSHWQDKRVIVGKINHLADMFLGAFDTWKNQVEAERLELIRQHAWQIRNLCKDYHDNRGVEWYSLKESLQFFVSDLEFINGVMEPFTSRVEEADLKCMHMGALGTALTQHEVALKQDRLSLIRQRIASTALLIDQVVIAEYGIMPAYVNIAARSLVEFIPLADEMTALQGKASQYQSMDYLQGYTLAGQLLDVLKEVDDLYRDAEAKTKIWHDKVATLMQRVLNGSWAKRMSQLELMRELGDAFGEGDISTEAKNLHHQFKQYERMQSEGKNFFDLRIFDELFEASPFAANAQTLRQRREYELTVLFQKYSRYLRLEHEVIALSMALDLETSDEV